MEKASHDLVISECARYVGAPIALIDELVKYSCYPDDVMAANISPGTLLTWGLTHTDNGAYELTDGFLNEALRTGRPIWIASALHLVADMGTPYHIGLSGAWRRKGHDWYEAWWATQNDAMRPHLKKGCRESTPLNHNPSNPEFTKLQFFSNMKVVENLSRKTRNPLHKAVKREWECEGSGIEDITQISAMQMRMLGRMGAPALDLLLRASNAYPLSASHSPIWEREAYAPSSTN